MNVRINERGKNGPGGPPPPSGFPPPKTHQKKKKSKKKKKKKTLTNFQKDPPRDLPARQKEVWKVYLNSLEV